MSRNQCQCTSLARKITNEIEMRSVFLLISALALAKGAVQQQNGNSDPSQAPAICAATESHDVLVAHEYCNKFYKCDHGQPVAFDCEGSLQYNPATEICDWPYTVDCGDRIVSEDDADDSATDNDSGNNENGDNGGGGCGCNDNPSEAPTICEAADSDDVLIAHENCNKFYKCAHGVPVALRCYGSLLYNPSTEQCDWPENVECGDRVIPEPDGEDNEDEDDEDDNSDTGNCDPSEAPAICAAAGSDSVLVAHENCNQYYICASGHPVAMNCGANLLFNPALNICDWPENVECGDRIIPDPDSGDNGGSEDGDNNNSEDGDNDNGSDSGNCDPSEAPAICAAEGSDSVLVAHENCNQYYICASGHPVAMNCGANLLFNPALNICDWPENVECGDRIIPDPDSGDNGGSEDGDNNNSEDGDNDNGSDSGNCDPSEAPAICAAEGSDSVLVAHENCNKYYICAAGYPVAMNCGANLLFNPALNICDWPENVECGDRIIPDLDSEDNSAPEDEDNDNGEDGDNDNGGGGCGCNDNPGEAPAICAAEGSNSVLVAHENCNMFYICSFGRPVEMRCGANLLYNPALEQCDWPENVDCGDRVIPDDNGNDGDNEDNGSGGEDDNDNGGGGCGCNDNPSEAPAICAAEGSNSVLVAHENCNMFYICSFGRPVEMRCGANLLYNPALEQCDWPENVDCGDRIIPDDNGSDGDNEDNGSGGEDDNDNGGGGCGCNDNPSEAPAICAAEGSNSVLVAHENCNMFYICSFGRPVEMRCGANLLYNPALEQCDWPENVNCGDRVIPDGDGNEDNGNGGEEDNDNGGEGCGCNDNPSEAPALCAADGSDGVFVAHENCNQFYICANGNPVTLTCPSDLLYNPSTEQCDWPHLVDCGDRVIPDGDNEDNNGDNDGGDEDNGNGDNGGGDNGGGGGGCGCHDNPSEAPDVCAAEGSDGVFVAHENCNQYYVCAHGNPVALLCPSGLLYRPNMERCDWPHFVDCGDRVIPEDNEDNGDNDGGDEDNGNGEEDNGGGGCGCHDNPSEAPAICAAEGSDGVFVAHENCNQFFICAHGNPVTLDCPSGLLYNPSTERCDWPHLVDCGDRVIPDGDNEDNNGDNGGGDEDNGNGDNGGGDNGGGGGGGCGCHDNPSEAPDVCAAEGSDGVFVAHENCNQYYVCAHGNPVALLCPPGLLYRPNMERCDWPHFVDCGDRVIPEDNEDNGDNDGGDEDNGNGEEDNGGGGCGCHDNPSEAPAICAAEGSDGVFVAHENCNQFFICAHGNPVTLDCPSGLLYNPSTERCDWPHLVDCGDRVIPDGDNEDNNGDNGGGDEDNGNGDNGGGDNGGGGGGGCGCHDNPSEAPEVCAAEGSDGVFVAHENCNQYFVCAHGNAVALLCPPGLLYRPDMERCDWPHFVDCGDRVIPEEDGEDNNSGGDEDNENGDNGGEDNDGGGCGCHDNPSEAPAVCGAEGSDGVFVAHENCNQFFICAGGNPVVLDCPIGLLYDPSNERCDWPQFVNCGDRVIPDGGSDNSGEDNSNGDNDNGGSGNCDPSEAPAICAAEGSNGVLVAHEQCNMFYFCSFGVPTPIECVGGLHFNPALNSCDWPENVDCGDRNPGDSDLGEIDNGGSDNDNDGENTPIEVEAICASSDSEGLYLAHPTCCNQFYICIGGKPNLLDCPSNTLYDPETHQCDWPQNVDCGNRVITSNLTGRLESLKEHFASRRRS